MTTQTSTPLRLLRRDEAAALLQLSDLHRAEDIERAARQLRERGWPALAIVDESGDDYAHTPEASGWLRGAPLVRAQGEPLPTAAVQDALARGFVPIEALVLGKMAAAAALDPAPASLPRAAHLPRFSLPDQPETLPAFAPLAERDLGLYAIVDSADWVRRVLAGGVRTVQLRIKSAQHPALREEIRASVVAARAVGAQLFINDHWRVALEEGAYGVHLGQEDLATADLAALASAGIRLGVSTHAYWEVCRAWMLQPSYIACGPVHPTQAKAMPWVPQGNGNLAYWCALLPCPVVAIAGMDEPRTVQAMQAGAAGVAVISAVTAAAAPEEAMGRLQQAVQQGRAARAASPLPVPAMARPTLAPTPGLGRPALP